MLWVVFFYFLGIKVRSFSIKIQVVEGHESDHLHVTKNWLESLTSDFEGKLIS